MTGTTNRGRRLAAFATLLAWLLAFVAGAAPAAAQPTGQISVQAVRPDGLSPLFYVRFEVTDAAGVPLGQRDTAPPNGIANFTVPAGGAYTVSMILPPPCQQLSAPQAIESVGAGETAALLFETDVVADCDLNPVAVWAYECPEAPDAEASYEDLVTTCTEPIDRLDAYLAESGQEQAERVRTGALGIPGRGGFAPVDIGDYRLRIARPDGEALPEGVAECLVFDPGNPPGGQWLRQFSIGSDELLEIELSLRGVRVSCDYFFFAPVDIPDIAEPEPTPIATPAAPDGPTADLEIHVSVCEPLYDGSDFFADCHDAGIEGASVELRRSGEVLASGSTGLPKTPGPGVVRFDGQAADFVRIRLTSLPGDAGLEVYCSIEPDGTDVAIEMDGTDAIVELPEGELTICDLSIIPTDDLIATPEPTATPDAGTTTASVRIATGRCPDGYSGPNWGAECAAAGIPDLTFTLTQGQNDIGEAATGPDGAVSFDDLPGGTYRLLQGALAAGETFYYAVRCVDADGADVRFEYRDPVGISLVVGDGQRIECRWYVSAKGGISTATPVAGGVPNATPPPAPAATSGRGSVYVALFLCTGRAGQQYNWYTDCPADTRAVRLVLTTPDGERVEQMATGGFAEFTGLADGPYDLRLASGAWCHAEADRVDNAGKVIVADGGRTGVYLYTCAGVAPTATPTGLKLPLPPASPGGAVPGHNSYIP
jgi:hypothetical protein